MSQAPGEFYAAYEIVSQMAALYGVAFQPSHSDAAETLRSVVGDMGTTFKLAESALNDPYKAEVRSTTSDDELGERLRRLQPRLNHWTSRRRWLRLLSSCETLWQGAIQNMIKQCPAHQSQLAVLATASRQRVAFLSGQDDSVRDVHRRRNASYAVPVPL